MDALSQIMGNIICFGLGIYVGWQAYRIIKSVRTPTKRQAQQVRPQPDADFPNPGRYEAGSRAEKQRKAATYAPVPKPFDKKDRSTWPVVPITAIPELHKPKAQPKMTTNVRRLQMRLALATEMANTMGYSADLREGIAELDAITDTALSEEHTRTATD